MTIEEKIEQERAALKYDDLTPVTKESVFAWTDRRKKEKQDAIEEASALSEDAHSEQVKKFLEELQKDINNENQFP